MEFEPKLNPPFATSEKKALKINAFCFSRDTSATLMPRLYSHYRPPKIKKTKTRWYIEYWYRVPPELKSEYNNKEWHRFRVMEDINRYKTDDYAAWLLKRVQDALQSGYNPFEQETPYFIKEEPEQPNAWSLNTGLDAFIEYCKDKRLRPKTIQSYKTLVNFLKDYFIKDNQIYKPVASFTKNDLKAFIADKKKGWNNSTTNNYISFTKVIFNWFVKEDVILKSPAIALETLPVNISRHKYYSDEIAEKLKASIKQGNAELYEFCQFIYYTATRPASEARLLQVKHILFDRKLLFVPATISKNKTDDYIPLGEDVLELLESRKGWPSNYYIFGGERKRSINYFTQQYAPYKKKFGLDVNFTLYGFKHSRCIDLAKAGADPYQIMRLFRHSSLEITMKYLRELGLTDFKEIHAKTKKF